MLNEKQQKYLVILIIGILTLTITIFVTEINVPQDLPIANSLSLNYDQAPWNLSIHFYAFKHDIVTIQLKFLGSFYSILFSQGPTGSTHQELLANHTLNTSQVLQETTRITIQRVYTTQTATNYTLFLNFQKPRINESNYNDILVYSKQIQVSYYIAVNHTQIISIPILFLLALFTGISYLLLTRYRLNPKTSKQSASKTFLSKKPSYKKTNQKQFCPCVFDNLEMLFPSVILLFPFQVSVLLALTLNYSTPIHLPVTPSIMYTHIFSSTQMIIVSLFLLTSSIFSVYAFNYLNKDYEHYWTYPFARKRIFYQLLTMQFFVIIYNFSLFALFTALVYEPLFLGIKFNTQITWNFLFMFFPHAVLMLIQSLLALATLYLTRSDVISILFSLLAFSFFESIKLPVLSHSYFILSSEYFSLYSLFTLLLVLLTAIFLFKNSIENAQVMNS